MDSEDAPHGILITPPCGYHIPVYAGGNKAGRRQRRNPNTITDAAVNVEIAPYL
jgi:hypothetical protein